MLFPFRRRNTTGCASKPSPTGEWRRQPRSKATPSGSRVAGPGVGGHVMAKTRIAVAGAGYIGLAHMAVAQRSPTCALSAIVDPAPAAQAVADKAGTPLYTSLDDLFAKDRPDGVILA